MPPRRPVLLTLLLPMAAFTACNGAIAASEAESARPQPTNADAGSDAGARRTGFVQVMSIADNDEANASINGLARFEEARLAAPEPERTEECVFSEPWSSGSGAGTGSPPAPEDSAGEIVVDLDVEGAPTPLFFEWNKVRSQYFVFEFDAIGEPKGVLRVRAAGATVPAFDAKIPVLAMPKFTAPATGTRIGDGDLAIAWTFTPGVDVIIGVSIGDAGIGCVPRGPSPLVVPGALLRQARALYEPDPNRDTRASASIFGVRTATVTAGHYDVDVSHVAARTLRLDIVP